MKIWSLTPTRNGERHIKTARGLATSIRNMEIMSPTPMSSFNDSDVQKLREELLKKHEGTSVEDFFKGEEVETKYGACYRITNHTSLKLNTIKPDKAKKRILQDLKLLNGIGESRERTLNNDGYKTIMGL